MLAGRKALLSCLARVLWLEILNASDEIWTHACWCCHTHGESVSGSETDCVSEKGSERDGCCGGAASGFSFEKRAGESASASGVLESERENDDGTEQREQATRSGACGVCGTESASGRESVFCAWVCVSENVTESDGGLVGENASRCVVGVGGVRLELWEEKKARGRAWSRKSMRNS